MSFQAYLDNIEKQTGITPNEFITLAQQRGFTSETKASEIASWLKSDYQLGHGHAMAMVHVIRKGPHINDKHLNGNGVHRDASDTLRLDGV